MFADGFNTEGLFTLSKGQRNNELNSFCKLEGMNYEQLEYEVHSLKALFGKIWHTRQRH
jgi:hypothetical protein